MGDREKLLNLVKSYLKKKINTETFANNFTIFFSQEINYDVLNEKEYLLFCELEEIASRFSPFEEDFLEYPYYSREEDVFKKAKEVYDALNKENEICSSYTDKDNTF